MEGPWVEDARGVGEGHLDKSQVQHREHLSRHQLGHGEFDKGSYLDRICLLIEWNMPPNQMEHPLNERALVEERALPWRAPPTPAAGAALRAPME